jgi:hypothetical protein
VGGPLGLTELLLQLGERGEIAVVAVDVADLVGECLEGLFVQTAVLRDALLRPFDELLARPSRLRDADDGEVELAAPGHGLKRREDLFVRKIAGRAKEDERVRVRLVAHFFST